MSNKKKTKYSEIFQGFKGLDVSSPMDGERLSEFRNFRLLPDGSALKRGGFRYLTTVEGEPRGEHAYSDGGESVVLSVIGDALYRISMKDGSISSSQVFGTAAGSVKFFDVCGRLYIYDGLEVYRYTGGASAELCVALPPLYGDGWSSYGMIGEINLPLNLVSPRIRIRYIGEGTVYKTLSIGMKIKSIDGIIYDGGQIIKGEDMTSIVIGSDGTSVKFTGGMFEKEADLFLTLDLDRSENADFESCDRTAVFDSFVESRAFAYGGDDKGRFYASTPVSEEDVRLAEIFYGAVAPIYFPDIAPMRVGGTEEINGVCRMYDRMAVFTGDRAFVTSPLQTAEGRERLGVVLSEMSANIGCAVHGAFCRVGGSDPVTLSAGGVYKWSVDPAFENPVSLKSVSDKVASLLDTEFVENSLVCRNRGDNEIWFGNSASQDGEVLVYNHESGAWYLFDGIIADKFFEVGDTVAFKNGNDFYVFDGEDGYDVFEWGEREIEAVIESAPFDFSCPAKKKHFVRAYVSCMLDGGEMSLTLADGRVLAEINLDSGKVLDHGDGVDFFDLRLRSGRTERARFILRAGGRVRQRIFGAEFVAT